MTDFEELSLDNLVGFQEQLIGLEIAFPEGLRMSLEDYGTILKSKGNITFIALFGAECIGSIIGLCSTEEDIRKEKLEGISEDSETIYVYNFVVREFYQNRGGGSELMRKFIESARERGYRKLVGHFRKGSSLYVIKKFGAHEKKVYENWCKSKETYVLCELNLLE